MYKIRLAGLDDIDELVRLRLVFLAEVGSLPGEEADWREVSEAFRRYLLRKMPTGEFLAFIGVSRRTGEIVATGGVTFFERPPNGRNLAGVEAYLSNMYTVPEWRGRGLGTALVEAIVGHVRKTAARRIWLHATEQGRSIYAKAGFAAGETDMELAW